MPGPTIADVAERAGVSKALVSFALNDRPGVSRSTRDRILAVARELGWTPDLRARSLSVGRSFACGLVIGRSPDVIAADPFFPAFIAGVEDTLSEAGQVLVLAVASPGRKEEQIYRDLVAGKRVDGVILSDLRVSDPRLALAAELGLPIVTLGVANTDHEPPSVAVDDASGIRAAVEHLVALGHTRITHIAGDTQMIHGVRRLRAFESAMGAAGLLGRVIPTDFSAEAGADATAEALSSAERPTAIIYSNDQMAVAGMGVAQERGLRIPDDLSIVGFDDTDVCRYLRPRLTSVHTDARGWGRRAAQVLLAAIAGEAPEHVTLEAATLTVRDSTARPPDPPAERTENAREEGA